MNIIRLSEEIHVETFDLDWCGRSCIYHLCIRLSMSSDMAKIDAILPLKMSKLNADDLARVNTLRARGEVEHKAGNHDASVKSLAEAMKILGIK